MLRTHILCCVHLLWLCLKESRSRADHGFESRKLLLASDDANSSHVSAKCAICFQTWPKWHSRSYVTPSPWFLWRINCTLLVLNLQLEKYANFALAPSYGLWKECFPLVFCKVIWTDERYLLPNSEKCRFITLSMMLDLNANKKLKSSCQTDCSNVARHFLKEFCRFEVLCLVPCDKIWLNTLSMIYNACVCVLLKTVCLKNYHARWSLSHSAFSVKCSQSDASGCSHVGHDGAVFFVPSSSYS